MNWINLILLTLGVLTVMFYGIGLIFFGILLWRIGTEMERSTSQGQSLGAPSVVNIYYQPPSEEEPEPEPEVDERFKLDEYSDSILENGK